MWYRHELGKRRAAKDRVVLRLPVDDLKFETLLLKVAWLAEDDLQRDPAEWKSRQGWYDAVELRI